MTPRARRMFWPAGMLVLFLALLAPAAAAAATAYPVPAVPIPSASPSAAPSYVGAPATAHPVSAPAIPANPWMAPGPWNNGHNDTYMSDTYTVAGPLGRAPQVFSSWLGQGGANDIGFVGIAGFDPAGNIVTPVVRGTVGSLFCTVTLTLLDPVTLDVLAEYDLPGYLRTSLLDRLPGAYFYLDNDGNVVIGTTDRTIQYISHAADGRRVAVHQGRRDRPQRLHPVERQDRGAAARLQRPHLGDHQGRPGADGRRDDEEVPRHRHLARAARRAHRQRPRRRPGRRRLHRLHQSPVPLRRGQVRPAGRHLARRVRRGRPAQAGPGRPRVGHHADADGHASTWPSPTTPTRT